MPLINSDTLFEKLLQDLPADLVESAYQLKAFTRARKMKSPVDLLRAVFLYSGLDRSLREVAGTMTLLLGEKLTDQAVSDRLQAAQSWLQVLLQKMFDVPDELTRACADRRLLAVDATQVTGVGANQAEYRIHTKLDLLKFEISELLPTDAKTGESLANFSFLPGDVVLGDRVYLRRKRILEQKAAKVEIIGRFSPLQCMVSDREGKEIDWRQVVAGLGEGEQMSVEVKLDDGKRQAVSGWVHIYRKSAGQAAQARRKARRKAQQQGRAIKQMTLFLCDYVMIFSSLAPGALSRQVVFRLYRVRWQVELVFKRWKSLLNLSKQRCRQMSRLGWSWLYGKLLYCLLIERRAKRLSEQTGIFRQTEQSQWRLWKMVKEQVTPLISGSLQWKDELWSEAVKVMGERKRKRRLQKVPNEVRKFLEKSFGGGWAVEAAC